MSLDVAVRLRARAKDVLDRFEVWRHGVPLECPGELDAQAVASRPSPRLSLPFSVGGQEALICYGAPSSRGRRVFGELVPWGELWRTGANEPTSLHLPMALSMAGLRLHRGRYSLYTLPAPEQWTIVVNRSIRQWGLTRPERGAAGRLFPSAYTPAVAAREVGRATVPVEGCDPVEQLRFRAEAVDDRRTDLMLEWEKTRLRIPLIR